MILKLPSYDAAPQEPKISMETTPEAENLGSNAEWNEDTGAENEPADNTDEQLKNTAASVDAEYGTRRCVGLQSY